MTTEAAATRALEEGLRALRGRVVCIDGGIGAGKSTLGRALARLCRAAGVDVHFERERRHEALLDLYVREPARYGFAFQLSMVADALNRLHTCEVLAGRGCAALLERGPLGNRVFGRLNRALGNISADEYAFYERLLPAAINGGTDLTVYLHVSHGVALRRMGVRGDPAEACYDDSYLSRLADAYFETMIDEAAAGTPLAFVPWDAECELLCELGAARGAPGAADAAAALTASCDAAGPSARPPLSVWIAAVLRQATAALAAAPGRARVHLGAGSGAPTSDAALEDETHELVRRYCGTYAEPRRAPVLELRRDATAVAAETAPCDDVHIDWRLLRPGTRETGAPTPEASAAAGDTGVPSTGGGGDVAAARWFHEALKYAIVCALCEGAVLYVHHKPGRIGQ